MCSKARRTFLYKVKAVWVYYLNDRNCVLIKKPIFIFLTVTYVHCIKMCENLPTQKKITVYRRVCYFKKIFLRCSSQEFQVIEFTIQREFIHSQSKRNFSLKVKTGIQTDIQGSSFLFK